MLPFPKWKSSFLHAQIVMKRLMLTNVYELVNVT